jgi:hypothetical protein
MSVGKTVLVACAVGTAVVAAIMLGWSVPRLVALGGGQPFDVRFTGYGHAEAVDFLRALGAEGRAFYDTVQLRLDTAFPILYFVALTWLLTAILGWAGMGTPARLAVAVVVVGTPTLLDFAENAAIRDMLRLAPGAVTAELVARASWFSTRKWSLALFGLTIAGIGVAVTLLRRRARATP